MMKLAVSVVDLDGSSKGFAELHLGTGEAEAFRLGRDLKTAAVPLHDVVIADDALVDEAADAAEIFGGRAPSLFRFSGSAAEAAVVVGQEAAQDLVGGDQIGGADEAEFTGKAVLKSAPQALDAAAVWIMPDSMMGHGTIDSSHPYHTGPLQLLVLYRSTGRWQKLELPTAVTSLTSPPVRIFGDWLVTTVMEWRSEPRRGLPVLEHGRPDLSSDLPDPHSEFLNRFSHLNIPGKLILQNLADDRKLTLNIGQEDSEILAIRADGELLFRVNDSIYSAEIVPASILTGPSDDRLTEPALIVKDVHVPEIHWAFWGPAPKNREAVINPRRSD